VLQFAAKQLAHVALPIPEPPDPKHPPPAPGPPPPPVAFELPPAPALPPELPLLLHVDPAAITTAIAPTAKTALHVCSRIDASDRKEGDNIASSGPSLKREVSRHELIVPALELLDVTTAPTARFEVMHHTLGHPPHTEKVAVWLLRA
jgi:hypothetical protein